MGVVAVGITDVVLHVADDHVVPVGDVERAILSHDRVGGAEVAIFALEQRLHGSAPDLAELPLRLRLRLAVLVLAGGFHLGRHLRVGFAVTVEVILLHPQEPDRVADQEVLLQVVGEMLRGNDLVGRHRPKLLLQELVHLEALALRPHLEGVAAGAVVGVAVAPPVEARAVGVGRVAGMGRDREAPRVKAIHPGGTDVEVRHPGRLMVVHQEDAALPIDAAVGTVDQIVRGVVGVLGTEALEQDRADVGLVVAVGVLEIQEIGARGDDHALAPELEPERIVDVGEDDPLVGPAVPVGVFQDHQAVVHRLERLPLGIGVPAGRPQPPLGIDLQLHGIGEIGKLLLGGEHIELEPLGHFDLRAALLGGEVFDAPLLLPIRALAAAAHVGLHGHRRRHVGVVDLGGLAGRGRPDRGVAVGRHHVEHHEFVLEHVGVALAVDEGQPRAVAPDVVAVGGPEAVVPVPVLVDHGGMHLGEIRVGRDGLAEQRLRDDVGQLAVAGVVEMAAVQRELLSARGEEVVGGLVEIDEGRPGRGGGPPRGFRAGRELGVVGDAVGQVVVARVLKGDRTEQHEPRRGALLGPELAVVFHRLDEILLVLLRPSRPVIRLVVAVEHEEHVGIDQFEIGRVADGALAPRTLGRRVAGDAHVPKPDVEAPELLLEHRLHPGRMLHPVGQAVAVDRDDIPLLERERNRRGVGGSGPRWQGRPTQGREQTESREDPHQGRRKQRGGGAAHRLVSGGGGVSTNPNSLASKRPPVVRGCPPDILPQVGGKPPCVARLTGPPTRASPLPCPPKRRRPQRCVPD